MKIIRRIKATVNLMNAIDGKNIYEQMRMFQAMTYLLYDDPIELDLEGMRYVTCPHALNELLRKPIPLRDFRGDRDSILENGNFEVSDSISSSGRAEVSHDLYNQMQMGITTWIGIYSLQCVIFLHIKILKVRITVSSLVQTVLNTSGKA